MADWGEAEKDWGNQDFPQKSCGTLGAGTSAAPSPTGSQQADLGSLSPKAKIPSGSHNGDVEGELVGGSRGLRLSTTYSD